MNQLKSKLVLGFCLVASSFAAAQEAIPVPQGVGPGVPGGPGPVPAPIIAKLLYDCPEGPGYLRMTAVDRWGNRQYRTLYVGSRKSCLAQAADLEKKRTYANALSVMAACSGNATYLVRWMIDEYGVLRTLPHVYFKDLNECLAKAAALNAG